MIKLDESITDPRIRAISDQLNIVLLGKNNVVEMVIACLLARGHLLFEDLPGLGKTTLAKALATCVGGRFSRVQCTPDLLPSDISGFNVFNQKKQEFEFHPGPVFSDFMLADEINRTTPRTQSALLEAMGERQVTIDNQTHNLASAFLVIATQNPVESHGAFPLPEAQLDRFAIKLSIGYLDRQNEIDLLADFTGGHDDRPFGEPALTLKDLQTLQESVRNIEVCEAVRGYIVDLGHETRSHEQIAIGLSPRGLITWQRMAQAWAFLKGRQFVTPDDVQAVAVPVMSLRIADSTDQARITIQQIIESVAVPGN